MAIPCVNYYSMNIGKRFWAMDNTDINRMFPGYDQGETTQRIADGLFREIKDYEFGIQLASFYQPGNFLQELDLAAVNVNMFKAINNQLINDGCGLFRGRQILPFEHLSRFQNDMID